MVKFMHCRKCGYRTELGKHFSGCPACKEKGIWSPLEVTYDYGALKPEFEMELKSAGKRSVWNFASLLPVETQFQITLGEGGTPLLKSRFIGEKFGMENLYLKNEGANPTAAHKDRFQSVSVSMALQLGYHGVTTVSTGNHGASMSAYAAAGNIVSKVFCPPETSALIRNLIKLYGGEVVTAEWEDRPILMKRQIEQNNWYPSTLLEPEIPDTSNPYGLEGYKTIAYEIFQQLGKVPEYIIVPAARGDTVYGVWKGFEELHLMGFSEKVPRVCACQPRGANSLEISFEENLQYVVTLKKPYSVATSTMEASSGYHALFAVRQSHGMALSVTDEEIIDAMKLLGREGLCIEAASAQTVACAIKLKQQGVLRKSDVVISLLTSTCLKWPDFLDFMLNNN